MAKVIMYCTNACPYCTMAERLLHRRGVEHIDKIYVDRDPSRGQEMVERTRRRTVPQIFIGDHHVGGYDDLAELDQEDRLVPMLAG